MTIPYTYVINCPDGRRYYGVRFAKGCNPSDLWTTYFTSSKHMKRLIQIHGVDAFEASVRKIFEDKESAVSWEQKVLVRLKVRTNENWVNVTTNKSWKSMEGDLNPSKRADVRQKISEANKGRARPDQAERMRQNHPMKDPAIKAKMVATRKEKLASGKIKIWSEGKTRPEISGGKHHRHGKKFKPLSDMNRKEYTCPHCSKNGKGPGMKRYHFDNCKIKDSSPAVLFQKEI